MKFIEFLLDEQIQPELIQSGSRGAADKLAQQFIRVANEEAYKAGRPGDPSIIRQTVDKLVNNFSSNILAAVDRELKFSRIKTV